VLAGVHNSLIGLNLVHKDTLWTVYLSISIGSRTQETQTASLFPGKQVNSQGNSFIILKALK
jgi:hypothetical protein